MSIKQADLNRLERGMMRRRLIVACGIISSFLLVLCIAGVMLTSISGWLLFIPQAKSRLIKITTVGSLPLPTVVVTSAASDNNPAGPAEESEAQSLSEPEPEAGTKTENDTPEIETPPPATIEEALEFSLPPGSVNSVTQEGLATRLAIPALNLDAPVVLAPIENQTWKVDHLGQAIGHLEGTAPPGSNSNLVLAGHVTLAAGVPGPFIELGRLAPGDLVVVYKEGREFQYVVNDQQTVDRTAVEVTYPTDTGQITLITCQNWNNITGRYDQRLVVTGDLVNN